jgi:hydrogenase nickel incorporation protein HypA/HybF
MHEYSIIRALLDRVEDEVNSHRATAVHHIWLRIGSCSGVEIELLEAAFEMVKERTVCAQAELEIVPVAARWGCPACDTEIEAGEVLQCPGCGRPARLIEGDEILLERLELEVS